LAGGVGHGKKIRMGCWWRQRVWEGRKHFFFVNKKEAKKTSVLRALAMMVPEPARSKSFLLLFFKKEALFFLFGLAGKAWMPAFAGMTFRGSWRF